MKRLISLVVVVGLVSVLGNASQSNEIHAAAAEGNYQKVKSLLKMEPSLVNAKDENGKTPLHIAAEHGHPYVVQLLIDNNADVNVKDKNGETPLFSAIEGEIMEAAGLEIVRILISHNADVNAQNNAGGTLLHIFGTEMSDPLEFVKIFLAHGANPNRATKSGVTPLDLAIDFEEEEGAVLLRKYGAISGSELARGEISKGDLLPEDLEHIERARSALGAPRETIRLPQRLLKIRIDSHGKRGLLVADALRKVLSLKGTTTPPVSNKRNWPDTPATMRIKLTQIHYQTEHREYNLRHYSTRKDFIKDTVGRGDVPNGYILVAEPSTKMSRQVRDQIVFAKKIQIPSLIILLDTTGVSGSSTLLETSEQELRNVLDAEGYDKRSSSIVRCNILPVLQSKLRRADASPYTDIGTLIRTFDELIRDPIASEDEPLLMLVENVFRIPGRGRLVDGRITQGKVGLGERVELIGHGYVLNTTVAAMEMFKRSYDQATAGDNMGLLLRGIERYVVRRGMVIAAPGSIREASKFEAEIYLLTAREGGLQSPLRDQFKPQIYFWNSDIAGTISLHDARSSLPAGASASVFVQLISPIAMKEGTPFAIRLGSRTIGRGTVTRTLK